MFVTLKQSKLQANLAGFESLDMLDLPGSPLSTPPIVKEILVYVSKMQILQLMIFYIGLIGDIQLIGIAFGEWVTEARLYF